MYIRFRITAQASGISLLIPTRGITQVYRPASGVSTKLFTEWRSGLLRKEELASRKARTARGIARAGDPPDVTLRNCPNYRTAMPPESKSN